VSGRVLVVRTGTANIASVVAALVRAGAEVAMTDDATEVADAVAVVLPGVGTFAAGVTALSSCALDRALIERVNADRPLLAICLGMQLLCEASEESPGVVGLGIVPGVVRRFTGICRVPQLGWNRVSITDTARIVQAGFVYFANSYCLTNMPTGWTGAIADHGGQFVAALERGSLLACQFHPELSGDYGAALLTRWLVTSGVLAEAPC
jgi:imidazole glycerol-phosphate synthase subunit HisH